MRVENAETKTVENNTDEYEANKTRFYLVRVLWQMFRGTFRYVTEKMNGS